MSVCHTPTRPAEAGRVPKDTCSLKPPIVRFQLHYREGKKLTYVVLPKEIKKYIYIPLHSQSKLHDMSTKLK